MKRHITKRSAASLPVTKAWAIAKRNTFVVSCIPIPSRAVFKRGIKGVYQHCSERHLHRYLSEFDFRYSNRVRLGINDVERAEIALKGIVGKRLTYQTANH